jgi:predicted enzyme related to lactoylglutathione lyase
MASVRYMVHDVTASVAFYADALGFKLERQFGPAMAIMSKDSLTLWLAGPQSSAAQPMPDGQKPTPGGCWNRFVLSVDDLPGLVAKLKASGAKFRNDIVKGPGGQQILIEDPSGNVVELHQPPG